MDSDDENLLIDVEEDGGIGVGGGGAVGGAVVGAVAGAVGLSVAGGGGGTGPHNPGDPIDSLGK